MIRDEMIRKLADTAGLGLVAATRGTELSLFYHLAVSDFLSRSDQYLTNDATREAAIAAAVEAEREACKWSQDEDDVWETSCGATWAIIDNGPAESGMDFCPHCGKPIEVSREESE